MNFSNSINGLESSTGDWQTKGMVSESTFEHSPQQILQSALLALRECLEKRSVIFGSKILQIPCIFPC
jgi:hypothetical protein